MSNKTTTKTVHKGSTPLYRFDIVLNQNEDPDLMWINKTEIPTLNIDGFYDLDSAFKDINTFIHKEKS